MSNELKNYETGEVIEGAEVVCNGGECRLLLDGKELAGYKGGEFFRYAEGVDDRGLDAVNNFRAYLQLHAITANEYKTLEMKGITDEEFEEFKRLYDAQPDSMKEILRGWPELRTREDVQCVKSIMAMRLFIAGIDAGLKKG